MKTKAYPAVIGSALLMLFYLKFGVTTGLAQGTAFTYQGQLTSGGSPANGSYDLAFTLYLTNLTGSAVAGPVTNTATGVTNGLFTTLVDFGPGVFTGTNQWLELAVRTNGGGAFATLAPRQPVTPAPFALFANSAGNVSGTISAAQLNGPLPPAILAGFAGTVALTNGGNSFSGSFTGNGAGLTNLMAASPAGMALIPAGSFTMGDTLDGEADASPTGIYVSTFYMDVNLVTLAQWQSVYFWATNTGYGFDNAGSGRAPNHPVQTVNWYDSVKWCNARTRQAGRTPVYYTDAALTQVYTNGDTDAVYANWSADGFRLPTEAEWEKAARGGLAGQRFPWGDVITETLANYYGCTTCGFGYDLGPKGYNPAFTNALPYTSPVASFAPNGYGLYDMAGNVDEWCWDWYGSPYGQPTTNNPTGPAGPAGEPVFRVFRGGCWYYYVNASNARCAARNGGNLGQPGMALNYFGLRCVRGH